LLLVDGSFALFAIYRFLRVLGHLISNPAPFARSMNLDREMVRRIDVTMLMYAFFLFYNATTRVYGIPGSNCVHFGFDAVIQLLLVGTIVTLIDNNYMKLKGKGGPEGPDQAKVAYLFRLYNKRGLTLIEMFLVLPAIALKYYEAQVPHCLAKIGLA
jgi:hypothetical protein